MPIISRTYLVTIEYEIKLTRTHGSPATRPLSNHTNRNSNGTMPQERNASGLFSTIIEKEQALPSWKARRLAPLPEETSRDYHDDTEEQGLTRALKRHENRESSDRRSSTKIREVLKARFSRASGT